MPRAGYGPRWMRSGARAPVGTHLRYGLQEQADERSHPFGLGLSGGFRAYEISPACVAADAETVVDWSSPWDDLLVNLELRHGWGAEMAIHYLHTVLVGLNAAEPAS